MTETQELLTHHWMLDQQAAHDMVGQGGAPFQKLIELSDQHLPEHAVIMRDQHRKRIEGIFQRASSQKLVVIGPCSLDDAVDYEPLFTLIETLQATHPDHVIAMRANGSKPRTAAGWRGLWHSTNPHHRQLVHDIHQQAFLRGIPLVTEITEGSQLSALAPRLSAAWIGARDIESSSLRSFFTAFQLPVGLKNGINGDLAVLEGADRAVRATTDDMQGSGIEIGAFHGLNIGVQLLGTIAVGAGNDTTAFIARGHQLDSTLSAEQRETAATTHLERALQLGKSLCRAVLIDGTHDVPVMFDIPRKNEDRFLHVLQKFFVAHSAGAMPSLPQVSGVLAEIGPVVGRTDPNLLLTDQNVEALKLQLATFLQMTEQH